MKVDTAILVNIIRNVHFDFLIVVFSSSCKEYILIPKSIGSFWHNYSVQIFYTVDIETEHGDVNSWILANNHHPTDFSENR